MKEDIKKAVREGYAIVARGGTCCDTSSTCCDRAEDISRKIGYTEEDLRSVPGGSNLGLGCGNPVALASLREGEIVLDLGSGAGGDCFLAANRVGKNGKVVGVDMTPEMIERARGNAKNGNYENVEFRLGELENLPVADNSADVIISNCVINLVPDKRRAFAEAFRVLKSAGRLMVSDIVLLNELPDSIKGSVAAYVGCLSGAMMKDEYLNCIKAAGFQEVKVIEESHLAIDCMANDPTAKAIMKDLGISPDELKGIADSVVSIQVSGVKPITSILRQYL